MKTTLTIDTSETDHVSVVLSHKGRTYEKRLPSRIARAQTALPLAEALMKDAGIRGHDLDEIFVKEGNGSYTGVRVGFAIANALGSFLHIPVNGKVGLAFPAEHELHYKKSSL